MTIHSVLGAVVIGLVVGALARLVLPGKQPIPVWLTILVGIGSALVGTALARAMGIPIDTPADWGELLVQVVVAVLGVALATAALGRSSFGRRGFGRPRSGLMRRW